MRALITWIFVAIYLSGCSTTPVVPHGGERNATEIVAGDEVKLTTTGGESHVFRVEYIGMKQTCSKERCFAAAEIQSIERKQARPPLSDSDKKLTAVILSVVLIALLVSGIRASGPMSFGASPWQ